ncbi:hypothetical protein CPB84DRAFT_1792920 [Gymnopilus junonius]|uniref:Enoyl reductase (ER) domain-containing protein n=1 Tax=Gymnopilus junonius TaxID=109634 RepID=A0A9P5NEE4_GYMJU|nr:hypothetical protein CPB84DRAFT_1792920 [Gymnopilus junonius]
MAPIINGRILFNEIPKEYPEPGKTVVYDASEKIDPDTVPLNGGFLLKTVDVSIDPYMRGRMRDPGITSYVPAFQIGKPIDGYVIAKVIRSENPEVKAGDHLFGGLPYQHYTLLKDFGDLRVIENKENLAWFTYLGVLGMPGKTAYMAWKEYSQAKKGETVFVSAGAGPLVIQLTKMDGLRTIGTAGSKEKLKFLEEIGTDISFNYKDGDISKILRDQGGIDIYWDNVGGDLLDKALEASKLYGRFIECGMISGYNTGYNKPILNLFQIFSRSLTMHGFIVNRLEPKYNDEFYKVMPPLVATGKIRHKEDVTRGVEKVEGWNNGKAVVHVADD